MCLSAIIWSNIKEVYYSNSKEDAAEIGFRDDMIYDYIKNLDDKILKLTRISSDEAKKVFDDFGKNENKVMY